MGFKLVLVICIFALFGLSLANDFNCNVFPDGSSEYYKPACYSQICTYSIKKQVHVEMKAAFDYMYMAAYFDQDIVNRPGIAKFLYESASEERQHGILMLNYLNLRGVPFDKTFTLTKDQITVRRPVTYKKALETSLKMEIQVTTAINQIIDDCKNDFHGADVFTDPILDEQHHGTHKIQSLLKEYNDLTLGYNTIAELALVEYLFDKKMA